MMIYPVNIQRLRYGRPSAQFIAEDMAEGKHKNATELDLGIMRQYGDSFLDLKGVVVCRYPTELTVIKDQQNMRDNDSPSLCQY